VPKRGGTKVVMEVVAVAAVVRGVGSRTAVGTTTRQVHGVHTGYINWMAVGERMGNGVCFQ